MARRRVRGLLIALVAGICLSAVGQVVIVYQLHALQQRLAARPVSAASAPVARNAASATLPEEPISLAGIATKGPATAPAAVIEFSDFQCPFCSVFAQRILPDLERDYIASGKVLFAFRHLPLESIHPVALKAAKAADCARRQGKFWQMHDRLFQDPRSLATLAFDQEAHSLGLDRAVFSTCIEAPPSREVQNDMATARSLGLTGTPAFLIGEVLPDRRVKVRVRLQGARPMAEFKQALDAILNPSR